MNNRQLAKKTFFLYGAIVLNIILGWLITKLNTEYLSVADYGKYAFFIVAVYLGASVFNFGIAESQSRLLAVKKEGSSELNGAGLLLLLFAAILFSVIAWPLAHVADDVFSVKIGFYLSAFTPLLGLILFQTAMMIIFRGSGQITYLAFSIFLPRLLYLSGLGYLIINNSYTLYNSLLTFFISLSVAVLLLILFLRPGFRNLGSGMRKLLYETKSYGFHIYVGSVAHEIFFHADKLVVSFYLEENSMAWYGLAYMLTFPLSHFSNALSTTLFNRFASSKRIDRRIHWSNIGFVTVSVICFLALREYIIIHLFSVNYLPAVDLMLPLALAFGFSGLSKPFTLFLMARGEGKLVRNITVTIPVFTVLANIVLIPSYGISGAAWVAFFAYLADLILFYLFYRRFLARTN